MYNVQPADLVASVDERSFIRGVPNQVPFVPQVPVNNPQLTSLVMPITGYMIHEIQAGAKKNSLRAQFYLGCSQNNWNNPQFNQAVAMAMEVLDLKVSTEQQSPQQAIPDTAAMVTTILATLLAKETGLLAKEPSFEQASMKTFQAAEMLKNRIAQMYQQRQMQMQQPQGGYGMPGMYPQPGMMPNNMMPMGGGYPPMGPMHPNMGMPMMGGGMPYHGMMPHNPVASTITGVSGRIPANAFVPAGTVGHHNVSSGYTGTLTHTQPVISEERDPPMRKPIEEAVYMQNHKPAPLAGVFKPFPGAVLQQPEPPAAVVEQPIVEHAVLHESPPEVSIAESGVFEPMPFEDTSTNDRPYDLVTLSDGSVVIPAALHPELKPTLSLDTPYRRVYNIDTHTLFYVLDKGSTEQVLEVLQPRTEEMDYLKHELNTRQRQSVKDAMTATAEAKVIPDWSLATSFKPHPLLPMTAQEFTEESMVVEEGEEDVLEVKIADRVPTIGSLSDAQFKAASDASEAVKEGAAFESYFDIADRVAVTEEHLEKVLNSFRKEDGFDYLHVKDILVQVRDADLFEIGVGREAFVVALDRVLTDEVNRVLKQDLSLTDWSIDNYVDDIAELRQMLLVKWGEAYLSLFDKTAEKTINMFFGVSVGAKHYISYRAAILWLPYTTGDLRLDFNDGGMIPEDTLGNLYTVAKEMLERDTEFNATRFFIFTDDAKLFEVRKGLLSNDCILLNQVEE